MQLTFTLLTTLLATAITAAPTALDSRAATLTFQVSNDQTGRQASATVAADGLARNLIDLFRNSAIDNNGVISGSSVQLTGGFNDNTKCFFQAGDKVINFNGKQTFADLDGDASVARPIELNGFNVQCS